MWKCTMPTTIDILIEKKKCLFPAEVFVDVHIVNEQNCIEVRPMRICSHQSRDNSTHTYNLLHISGIRLLYQSYSRWIRHMCWFIRNLTHHLNTIVRTPSRVWFTALLCIGQRRGRDPSVCTTDWTPPGPVLWIYIRLRGYRKIYRSRYLLGTYSIALDYRGRIYMYFSSEYHERNRFLGSSHM